MTIFDLMSDVIDGLWQTTTIVSKVKKNGRILTQNCNVTATDDAPSRRQGPPPRREKLWQRCWGERAWGTPQWYLLGQGAITLLHGTQKINRRQVGPTQEI